MQKMAIAMAAVLLTTLAAAPEAQARRRILGSEPQEEEKEAPKIDPEKAAKQREEAQKKEEEKKKKEAAARRKKEEAARAAREAAEKAAEEAEKKAEEEAERKKQEAVEKEKARLDANAAERLKKAKKLRRLWRQDGDLELTVAMVPGAPKAKEVVELRFELVRRLEVASARFGELEPQRKAKIVVEVRPPDDGDEDEPLAYVAHPLAGPGEFGVHFTPTMDGPHELTVSGVVKGGKSFKTNLRVFVGEWPPPDIEEEEKILKKAKSEGTAKPGRRILDG